MPEYARINFQVPVELDQAIRDAIGNRRGASISAFAREAIEEKLARGKREPEAELLLDRFKRLNDEGRQWLLDAALYASTSDEARQIERRKGRDDEADE